MKYVVSVTVKDNSNSKLRYLSLSETGKRVSRVFYQYWKRHLNCFKKYTYFCISFFSISVAYLSVLFAFLSYYLYYNEIYNLKFYFFNNNLFYYMFSLICIELNSYPVSLNVESL